MKAHIDSHLADIQRRVLLSQRHGKSMASVQLTRQFDVEPRKLWNAVTSPDEISQWFAPVSGEFKEHGSYAIEGNASGAIEVCDPLAQIVLTWEFAGDTSWVDLQFDNESRSGVSFDLNHTSVISPHWDQYGAGATGVGWELSYLGLYRYLTDPNGLKFDEETFAASEEGKQFVKASSQGWADASILAGTDANAARAAAERTTSFYLGI